MEIGGSTVIKLGTDGVSISVDEDENFVDILDRTLDPEQTDPKTVQSMRAILLDKGFVDAARAADDVLSRALLNNHGFYVAHDPTLVDVLASYDYSQEPAIEIRDRLRRMLWDLKGPFGPGALSGAKAQFLRAIEELYDANGDQGPAPLAEAIWLRRIEWQTPFERRKFAAEIEVLPKSAAAEGILICKGSEHLAEKYVNISVSDPDDPTRRARGTGSIERVARVGEAFSCDNGVNVTEMLAGRILRLSLIHI